MYKKQLFTFLFVLACIAPMTPVLAAQDSGATEGKPAVAAPVQSVEDEELILDEPGVKAPPPVTTQESAAPLAAPAVTPAPTPAKDSVAVKTAKAKKDTATTVLDEDLILDGGVEDLLGQEKPLHVKKAVPAKDASVADSAATDTTTVKQAATDSIGQPVPEAPVEAGEAIKTAIAVPEGPSVEKQKIEKVRSIDFGANLKEYRSPKLAMLMSLILPGSGQVYAQSNLLAAGFLALEAVVFGTGYAFVAKAKNQKKNARVHADSMYDAAKFEGYYGDLRSFLIKEFDQEKAESIILDSIFYGDSALEKPFIENAAKKNDAYYDDLQGESSIYARGWKDVTPAFSPDNGFGQFDTTVYRRPGDTVYLIAHQGQNDRAFGFSEAQARYIDLVNQSQSSARIGRNFYMSLLVNHIASAVMAGIVAKKHNDALLGEQSFLHRIDVLQQQVNTGSHTVNGYALQVRF